MEATHTMKDRIDLTEKKEKIFGRLLDVVRHFKLETRLRVAGGWVRYKLLGKDCYDIDIALDNMLGRDRDRDRERERERERERVIGGVSEEEKKRMQQQLMQMNQSMMGGYASPTTVTTDLIQQYLDENKQLILAILDNQNTGKVEECARSFGIRWNKGRKS